MKKESVKSVKTAFKNVAKLHPVGNGGIVLRADKV
jgi:hypothetical protein